MLIRGEDSAVDLPSTLTEEEKWHYESVWLSRASAGDFTNRGRTDA